MTNRLPSALQTSNRHHNKTAYNRRNARRLDLEERNSNSCSTEREIRAICAYPWNTCPNSMGKYRFKKRGPLVLHGYVAALRAGTFFEAVFSHRVWAGVPWVSANCSYLPLGTIPNLRRSFQHQGTIWKEPHCFWASASCPLYSSELPGASATRWDG